MRGAGERVVLGRYLPDANYIRNGVEYGGVFFDTSSEVYPRLRDAGIDPWRVNEAWLRLQHQRGLPIEFDFRNLPWPDYQREVLALDAVAKGDWQRALQAARAQSACGVPARLREAQWLLEHGYSFVPDDARQVVRCVRRQP